MPVAYTAILLMLLLAGWNPSLTLGPGPVDLLLLLDESDSIEPARNDAVWHSFLKQAGSLPAGSRISLMRFSDRAVIEVPWLSTRDAGFAELLHDAHPPRHRALDPGATVIGAALRAAVRQVDPQRHTALIISSDGVDSVTPAETALPVTNKNSHLSIFYLDTAGDRQSPALRIESIDTPPASTPGQPLSLSVAVESTNGGRGTLETSLNSRVVHTQALALEPGDRRVIDLHPPADRSGAQLLVFSVRDPDGNEIEHLTRVVQNRGDRQLLYIGSRDFGTRSRSLQADDWRVVRLQPQRLPAETDFFNRFDAVLLDDVGAGEIDAGITRNLVRAVERYGTGLLVLGGPGSFGSGGYRHAELESVLPLLSEASRPLPAAAFVFLVDKSGSMEAANRASSRLADALRAVSESARSLRPGDQSALLVFDRDVEVLLPLARRADPVTALDQAWQLRPSGGTLLVPALNKAIELLARSDAQQRFLILVTDGYVDADNSGPLKHALQQANIRLIALAIGKDPDLSTLQGLAAINGGRVLRVDDTAELPRFMRRELESEQHSWHSATVTPHGLQPAPFISEQPGAWRALDGYQVTRARPSASVYVATQEGDPLLAVGQAGAGRVAALPGGLLEPQNGQQNSQDLLVGLLDWLQNRQWNPDLNVSHRYVSGKLRLVVDAVDANNEWHPASAARVWLTSPGGMTGSQPLEAVAPGRYAGVIDAPAVGVYEARITVGDEQTRYSAYLANDSESETHAGVAWLRRALATGEIRRWTQAGLNQLQADSSGRIATRAFWLLLALCGYLALIAYERSGGLRALKQSLVSFGLRRISPARIRAGSASRSRGSGDGF